MEREIEDAIVGDVARMSFPIHEKAVINLATYGEAYRIHDGKRVRMSRLFVTVVCLLFGLVLLYVFLMSRHVAYLLFSIAMLSAAFGAGGQSRLRLRNLNRQLKALGKQSEPMEYELTREGVRVHGKSEEVFRKWSQFVQVKEGSGLILGYLTKQAFQVFPVREFSPRGRAAVRHFLEVETSRFSAED